MKTKSINLNLVKKEYKINKGLTTLKDSLKKIKKLSYNNLRRKYKLTSNEYSKNMVNDIIFNEKSKIVAKFKDCLILDDCSEFMKRFYKMSECKSRLPKILDFYENFSKIFPNYTGLEESKYIYRNIQKKQKMIDLQQKTSKPTKPNKKTDVIFNDNVYDSIMNITISYYNECVPHHGEKELDKNKSNLLSESIDSYDSLNSIEALIDNIDTAEKGNSKPEILKGSIYKKNNRVINQSPVPDENLASNFLVGYIKKEQPSDKINKFNQYNKYDRQSPSPYHSDIYETLQINKANIKRYF